MELKVVQEDRERELSPEEAAAKAKVRFCQAMQDFRPLRAVREHPLLSIGCAFALGAGLPALLRKSSVAALLPLFMETGMELTKKLLNQDTNRRP